MPFELESNYKPKGDQGQAIAKLLKSIEAGNRHQTLLGVTGSGKTFTIANVIKELDRPALIISHNKTLARSSTPSSSSSSRATRSSISSATSITTSRGLHPASDTYIEKDSSINEEIERLRLSATSALLSRRDTIVVASVSCIYGVTSPEDYLRMLLTVKKGQQITREAVLSRLIDMLYGRNDMDFSRGKFRVRGDVVEVYPATADEEAIRLEFFGDEIERSRVSIPSPATRTSNSASSRSIPRSSSSRLRISSTARSARSKRARSPDRGARIAEPFARGAAAEDATEYDLEMLQEMGFCNGIENYSRHLSGRMPGSKPFTLLDFFPKDYLLVMTSHTPRSRRSAACSKAIDRARRCS
jgi:excinuclease ABC subunit B